jgi:hypothetical protein
MIVVAIFPQDVPEVGALKASLYWVLPTNVPPKEKEAGVRIGEPFNNLVGTSLGGLRHTSSAWLGLNVVLPDFVVINPVLGSKLTATFFVLMMRGMIWVGIFEGPGFLKGLRSTMAPG